MMCPEYEDYDYDYDDDDMAYNDYLPNAMNANRDKNGMTKTDAYKGRYGVRNTEHDGTPTGTKSGFSSKASVPKG